MSDFELDAELLALAGGDDEADNTAKLEEPAQTPTPQPSPKDIIEDKPSATSSQPRKGVAQKKMSKSARGGPRRRRKDDSDGEADVSSPESGAESLGSGAMDESDSEADAPGEPDDDNTVFPIEGKFYSDKDRSEIMALPEIRREQIIAEREEEALRKRQDAQLKLLLQKQEKETQRAQEKKKRKAGAADLEDSPRKSSRARKQSTALESFKREREARLKERERDADRRKRRSPTARSDQDAEGDSEVEWDDGARGKEELPPDLKDFERVRVGRSNFAKVCFYPGFEEAIRGCFTRVSVGPDPATGQNAYRMAQIKGFIVSKPYKMEAPNGKTFWTDMYALVAHGKAEKEWPFIACSDGKFTEQEFNRYRITVTQEGLHLTSRAALQRSCQGIHDLLNRPWTDADIQEKLYKQNKLSYLNNKPRTDDSPSSLNGTSTPTTGAKAGLSQAELLWQVNQANRKKDREEIRKAELENRRRTAAGRAAAAARAAEREKAEAEAAATAKALLQVPDSNIDDLFASDISRTGSPAPRSGINTPKRVGTPLGKKLAEKKEKKEGLPTFRKRNMDDDLIGAMDLGIEIDI